MKRNITINLFGQLYAIDEDAYNLLKCYFDSMQRYFAEKEGGEEIADDIEHRVAELLWQKKEEGVEAISIEIVKDIINKIGNASEIDVTDNVEGGHEAGSEADSDETEENETAKGKRAGLFDALKGRYLYRDPNDRIVGGVCAGLANFTGCGSSVMWRLGVILAIFCSFFLPFLNRMPLFLFAPLLYIIMWMIIPLPSTPEDRLKMKGHSVTPESINEEIINEMEEQKADVRRQSNNGGCLSLMLKVLLALCLLPFLFTFGLLVFLFLFVVSVIFGLAPSLFPEMFRYDDKDWMSVFLNGNVPVMVVGLCAAFGVVGLTLYGIVRGLRGNGKSMRTSGVVSYWLMWVIGVCVTLFCVISLAMNAEKARRDYWNHVNHSRTLDTVGNDSVAVSGSVSADVKAPDNTRKHSKEDARGLSSDDVYKVDTVGWSE